MAKRRERRVPSSSDRREDRVESSKRALRRGDSDSSPKTNTVLFLFFVMAPAIAVLVYHTKYAPRTNRALSSYVHQQGLVKADVNYQEILTRSSGDIFGCEGNIDENFSSPAKLCRNNKGYDLAKSFNSKFTHLSPVWYDLRSQGTNLVLEGRHNADIGWITELRTKGDAWVLPRVVLEAIPMELLRKKKQRDKAIDMIIKECKEMDYDGIVLESWSRWAAYGILHEPDMRNMVNTIFSNAFLFFWFSLLSYFLLLSLDTFLNNFLVRQYDHVWYIAIRNGNEHVVSISISISRIRMNLVIPIVVRLDT